MRCHLPTARRSGALTRAPLLALALILTACASGGQARATTPRPTPSATPTATPRAPTVLPPIHTISLGSYKANWVLAGAAGLVLLPPAPPPSGPVKSGTVYPTSLAFYRYRTQRVEPLATAPIGANGAIGGIVGATYGGDWVSYVTVDAQQSNAVLWAYNVTTGERLQVDSAARDPDINLRPSLWISNGTELVWYAFTYHPESQTTSSKLEDFSYTTRQIRTLYTSQTQIVQPVAMNDTSILLDESDASGNGTTWLFQRDQRTLIQVSAQAADDATMNARYAVWGDARTQTSTLVDLTTGKETPNWVTCTRPVIAETRPYVVCFNFDAKTRVLLHVPDGIATPFEVGTANLGSNVTQDNGRVFWVAASSDGSEGASTISYFDLPAQ